MEPEIATLRSQAQDESRAYAISTVKTGIASHARIPKHEFPEVEP
jgi:hypothetical protein